MKNFDTVSEQTKDFFQRVFEITRLIPEGRVTSYGSIAKALGTAKSSRMVGWAMNASHREKDIPAHRVVNRNGVLTGKAHFNPPEIMQERLEKEGIKVVDDKIVDFEKLFWDPQQELGGSD
ncbi:MGMT family protein [Brumimicrobium oceani]|uniref:Cysteine methyltransferase n=1 Tax=Brumimicrobium oceani TaxID=2100725 RepID=A0A2U2XAJ4_9FLAO|nr:MGMT family protein [Brumimicrobium oceani]PWH84741.1 cysteine methyltransferase [Brumimicrobium oceani]